MNCFKTLLFLMLLVLNFTVLATDLTLDERFKAAELIEVSDIYAALPLYQELVDQGYTESKVRLAALFLRGLGDKETKEEKFQQALLLLHEAADEGSIKAYYALSVMYHDADSLTPNAELGTSWLIKAAEAGEPRAQNQLGSFYLDGTFVAKNVETAIYWYQQAIKQNYNSAKYNLANLYLDSIEITKENIMRAQALYLSAANQNHSNSKFALGNIYYDDKYGLKNEKKSYYWLNEAAGEGNTYAQTGLASCYRYGIGTNTDYEKALYWYQLSSDT
ncbi:MAG: TPR repeat protein, partial [Oleispira sp.]